MKTIPFDIAYKRLKQNSLSPIYFLMGEDQFLQQYFIEELITLLFKGKTVNKTLLIPDDMGSKEIMAQLMSVDLFNDQKLFILINPNGLKGKVRDEFIDFYQNPPVNSTLVIIHNEFGAKNKFMQSLSALSNPITCFTPFENDMVKWSKLFFNNNGISNVSIEILNSIIKIAGDSLNHLKNEIDKIVIFIDDPSELNTVDFSQYSGWKKKSREYEFFNFLGQRELKESLRLGITLVSQDTTMMNLLYPLTEFFQDLLFFKIFKGTNQVRKSYTRLSPSVNKKIPNYAEKFTSKEIVFALMHLGKIDAKLKTSRIKDESAITEFVYRTIISG